MMENYIIENNLLDIGENFLDLCSFIKLFVNNIDVNTPKLPLKDYDKLLEILNNYLELSFILNRGWVEDHPNIYKKYDDTLKIISNKQYELEFKYNEYFNGHYEEIKEDKGGLV